MLLLPVPAPLEPAIVSVQPRVEEAGGRAPRPRFNQAKIAHLRYAAVASPALQSGQVQAGRPLNPLRGTAARLSSWLRSGQTLRLAPPHHRPRRYYAPLQAGPTGSGRRELNLRGRRGKHVLAFERLAASGASLDTLGIGLARLLVVVVHPSGPPACPPNLPPNGHTLSARATQLRHKFEPPPRSSIPPRNPQGAAWAPARRPPMIGTIVSLGGLARPNAWTDYYRNFA